MMRFHVCFAIVVGFIAGCRFGAPSGTRQLLLAREQTVEKLIQSERVGFDNDVATSRVPELAAIAARERISDSFGDAEQLLLRGRTCANADLDEYSVETGAGECRLLLDRAEGTARAPRLVIAVWTQLWQDASTRAREATAKVTAAQQAVAAALQTLDAPVRDKTLAYPGKREDLEARLAALGRIPPELTVKLAELAAEVSKNDEGKGDVAVLERALAAVDTAVARSRTALLDLPSRLQQLDADDETRLVRLGKTTLVGEEIFTATLRILRNGVAQPDVVVPVDALAFTSYLVMALGVQRVFPTVDTVKTRPLPEATLVCADRAVVDLDLEIAHKAAGQYEDETQRSPSPGDLSLGHVGDTTYGAWETSENGRSSWLFGAQWLVAHPRPPEISDEAYARYSAWRFDNGFACGFDRAGARTGAPASCIDTGAQQLAELVLAACAPPPEPVSHTVRGAGPRIRARGMGGGGK